MASHSNSSDFAGPVTISSGPRTPWASAAVSSPTLATSTPAPCSAHARATQAALFAFLP
ncbi:Uncharacterised protein [Mycobacteroides abscessus subsp. abscessus]|nr:Uncharacterised protein [Mycobacteroides abscessus subsp. abscessus]